MNRSAGIILGMPPLTGDNAKEIATNLGTILAAVNPKQTIGLFESYGGNDEPIDPLLTKFLEVS